MSSLKFVEVSNGNEPESILEEAQRIVHGDRGVSYGHPFHDFSRTAGMLSALFKHKITQPFTPQDVGIMMICVKLSRQVNMPKRDNLVDAAGYAETISMTEQFISNQQSNSSTT